MTRESILITLTDLIASNLEVQLPEVVLESSRLFEDLHIDSLMVLQLVVYIEEEFDVVVPEEGVDPAVFSTMGMLVTFIQELQEAMKI
ncbi:acyl carrier protein [Fontibacillus phaseoli]|uniref:Acyl carrier protein n=1 Tax=Fontibacillus phaseoli TaxID=1416533 RepID=A0A369B734_9BACL|nr:phosphopantetheine-binding protein [Fontibacillus phaseoli]RCX17329.1 acyl carrier protein [Fontibacillus phaseoli]